MADFNLQSGNSHGAPSSRIKPARRERFDGEILLVVALVAAFVAGRWSL